jgi:uncharacterized membrane protein
VLDNGTGIAGALVTANTSISNTTDASGSFSFLVAAGTYNLTAAREPEYYGNGSVVVNATSGSIAAQDIKLSRKPTGNITGTVKRYTPGSSIADILDIELVLNQIQPG